MRRRGLRTGQDPAHPGDRPIQAVQGHRGRDGHHRRGGSLQEVTVAQHSQASVSAASAHQIFSLAHFRSCEQMLREDHGGDEEFPGGSAHHRRGGTTNSSHQRDLLKFDPLDAKLYLFHTFVYEVARRKHFVNPKVQKLMPAPCLVTVCLGAHSRPGSALRPAV